MKEAQMRRREARQILETVDILIEDAEDAVADMKALRNEARDVLDGPFVQIKYASGGVLYTYRDPSGRLEVGDLVEVPVTYGTKVGVVAKLGRSTYSGPVKTVLFKLERRLL